uniref:Uncharacterized protein n=1 Tax=Acrobeloides nanus TaxID=290746 RepID=A0A914DD29_9BILA
MRSVIKRCHRDLMLSMKESLIAIAATVRCSVRRHMAMHEGKPYCNRCHSAMFGPKTYGHGGTESHTFLEGTTGGQQEIN